MGSQQAPTIDSKRKTLTPKAIIHQRFGTNAVYKVEEVQEHAGIGCPGLNIPQKGPCHFRCSLQLPEVTVVSELCKRKKDAEQSAAEKAIEKLGISSTVSNPTAPEARDELVARLKYLFSDAFFSTVYPLSGHFRAALQRKGHLNSYVVPLSVVSFFDSKLINICKCINPEVESNPWLVVPLILKAAAGIPLLISENQLSISRPSRYPPEIVQAIDAELSKLPKSMCIKAVRIPCSIDKTVEPLLLNVSVNEYYLDGIAQELGLADASKVLVSRILINKMPNGVYKLSREATLTAELPVAFTTRSNWRGSYPRDILCTFCRQHRLSVPVIVPLEMSGSHKKLKLTSSCEQETDRGGLAVGVVGSRGFRCEIKIFSKTQELILWCSPEESFKKQSDAIQDAALKILTWLNNFFKNPEISIQSLTTSANEVDIQLYPQYFYKEFALCQSVHTFRQSTAIQTSSLRNPDCSSKNTWMPKDTKLTVNDDGHIAEVSLSTGSLACISYNICFLAEGECMKELLESNEEFEFEIGVKAVVPHLESVVTQMSLGQSVCYNVEVPAFELIMASATDFERVLSLLDSGGCSVEYSITLLRVTEPLEERMEQALFSPPLSKQRVEFALQHIKRSCAVSLVDFGCGSGSLLDSLLAYPTSLEKIVGVDISTRSLARAAKILHTKLTAKMEAGSSGIKSAVLYDGSVTAFDNRLYGFDIGTCLEVIEHMEEEQACIFGDVVLSSFRPKILIVSTPNFEYNVILQKSTLQPQEDDPDEKNQTQSCKFRNHDHKFEWTREQFNDWASKLAERHNYGVEFSGVGGVEGVEPGFASQIAVFTRRGADISENIDSTDHYNVIWDWSSSNSSTSPAPAELQ